MSVAQEHRGILRLFYVVVAVTAIATGVLLISLYQRYASEVRARGRVEQFHLRTLMLTREISMRLNALGAVWPGTQAAELERPPAEGSDSMLVHQLPIVLPSIEQALDSIVALQSQRGDALFRSPVARARERFARLREALEADGARASSREVLAVLGVFELAVYQLDRLHSIAVEQALRDVTTAAARRNRNLAMAAAVVLAVAGALIWRLLFLLRGRLRQHAETREALLEKERQLLQTQKMEALGTLVGGVAHDFNNLLTAILGHLEILMDDVTEDDPRHDGLCEIRRAGERAAELTRQLLVFSRYDATEAQVVDLDLLIRDIQPLLRRVIRADISLVVSGCEDLYRVKIDHVQMEQVLINLASNASDAMPRGGTLTIHTLNAQIQPGDSRFVAIPAGSYARITVKDTGEGMPPEVRSRVFEPFFTTKDPGRGTGLGLSTVHGILTKSNGHILVESETGRGTTFDVYLPRFGAAESPAEAVQPSAEGVRGSETVLVVEDQDQVREVTAAGLRSAGYRVLLAANGVDALRVCSEHQGTIHLILSDVVMPQMRGPEFVEQARRLIPNVAVVFTSGYSEEAVLEAVRESGCPLVAKPFKLQHLLRVIRAELGRTHGKVARSAPADDVPLACDPRGQR